MTRYYLELSNAREHKFYELVLEDAALHLRYGRIGTDGQRQSRIHASPEATQKEADKRLGEKRKKGYVDAVMGEREKQDVILPRLRLPDLLRPHRSEIEATLRPSVHLVHDGQPGRPWSCKVGGVPYREQGQPWPTTPEVRRWHSWHNSTSRTCLCWTATPRLDWCSSSFWTTI